MNLAIKPSFGEVSRRDFTAVVSAFAATFLLSTAQAQAQTVPKPAAPLAVGGQQGNLYFDVTKKADAFTKKHLGDVICTVPTGFPARTKTQIEYLFIENGSFTKCRVSDILSNQILVTIGGNTRPILIDNNLLNNLQTQLDLAEEARAASLVASL